MGARMHAAVCLHACSFHLCIGRASACILKRLLICDFYLWSAGGGGGSSKQVAPVDRGNGSAAKLLPEKLPGLPAELPSQGSLDRAASLDRSMAPSARPPRPPQPKASSFT